MENENILLTKINKQKNTIIVLIIFLCLFAISTIAFVITNFLEKKEINFYLTDYYRLPQSFYYYYEIEANCLENQTLSILDFTYINNEKGQIVVSKIEYNNKEYTKNENFTITKNNNNIIKIYITLSNDKPDTIYYKLHPIKFGIQTKIYNF